MKARIAEHWWLGTAPMITVYWPLVIFFGALHVPFRWLFLISHFVQIKGAYLVLVVQRIDAASCFPVILRRYIQGVWSATMLLSLLFAASTCEYTYESTCTIVEARCVTNWYDVIYLQREHIEQGRTSSACATVVIIPELCTHFADV